jgi:diguanylate cyclase (GGDEF)-like protein
VTSEPPLKVVVVDDNPYDAELSLMQLRRAGNVLEARTASDEGELRAALASFDPDVVLCDFAFPGMDGEVATAIVHERRPGVPVIFVSGTISEERAVTALHCGAVDYVLKSNLVRLPSAVEHAVGEARSRRQLEGSLIASEARVRRQTIRLETLWRLANDASLGDADRMLAMLTESASTIRPQQRFRGFLTRIEGADLVVLAVTPGGDDEDPGARRHPVGARVSRGESSARLPDRTQYWDRATLGAAMPPITLALGWNAEITTRFTAGASQYVLTFGSTAHATFEPNDVAYIEVLADFFANALTRSELERSLLAAEGRLRRHAERLETLWRIANDPSVRGDDRIDAMLGESASAIRPHQHFRGIISRVLEGHLLVLHLTPGTGDLRYPVGTRLPIANTVAVHGTRTRFWDDIAAGADAPAIAAELGWHSVITTRFSVGTAHYVLTFGSTVPTEFGADDVAYVEVLAASFTSQFALDESERRTRRHVERLESLWRIINNPNLRDEDVWIAMLREAAKAIRPGQNFHGRFVRVEGEDIVFEASVSPAGYVPSAEVRVADSRERIPLAGSIVERLLAAEGGTQAWEDLRRDEGEMFAARVRGLRAVIGTTFVAGGKTYALIFSSTEPPLEPFGPLEQSFLEVLASFFARDVQERWHYERIAYQQSHDVLTGLLNRSQFRSRARSAALVQPRFALMLIDIDLFREINETYGHMIGDALLVEVATALQERAAGDEIIGRIAGDVFGVYVSNPASAEAVLACARRFAEAFGRPFSTGDRDGREFVSLTATVGVAMAPYDGREIDDILLHADAALFVAKERGAGSIVAYTTGMEGDPQRRTTLRNDLTAAIGAGQFVLYFQPHVDIRDNTVTGCEALIRWQHPTRGLLLPGQFIPFAEQTGLITGIDEWVMSAAFAAAGEISAIDRDFRLYFNLSGRQAGSPSVVRAFVRAARAGVPIRNLGVEITESDAMRNVESTRRVCRALRRLGVRVAIDDFGTGYSSLSSLKRLPVDIIKIDRSFIAGVLDDPHDETIAETIMGIAERFGFTTLAEGVERPEEVEWLRARSCRLAQGYVFSRPLPIAEFKAWIAARAVTESP